MSSLKVPALLERTLNKAQKLETYSLNYNKKTKTGEKPFTLFFSQAAPKAVVILSETKDPLLVCHSSPSMGEVRACSVLDTGRHKRGN